MVMWTTSGRTFSSMARWSVNQAPNPVALGGGLRRSGREVADRRPARRPAASSGTRGAAGRSGRRRSALPSRAVLQDPEVEAFQRPRRPAPGIAFDGQPPRRLADACRQVGIGQQARSPRPRKPSGSSSMRMSRPGTASIPSAPSVVETMALPIAMASTILSRVPPPSRSGTTTAAAAARCGRRSATKPVTSIRGPASAKQRRRRPARR